METKNDEINTQHGEEQVTTRTRAYEVGPLGSQANDSTMHLLLKRSSIDEQQQL